MTRILQSVGWACRPRCSRWRRVLGLLCAALLSSCAHNIQVFAPTVEPARVPVQVFPLLWVAGDGGEEEQYLLDNLAAALAKDRRREVRRVPLSELEPARLANKIPQLTAVVRMTLVIREGTKTHEGMLPITVCGLYGCYTQYQYYQGVYTVFTAEAMLYVHDGPSAVILQRARFAATVSELEAEDPRASAIEQLAERMTRGTDIALVRRPYVIERSRVPLAKQGVTLLERGQWAEGRALLEQALSTLAERDAQTQATVWYDLGVARLLSEQGEVFSEQAEALVRQAFTRAYELVPKPRYRDALTLVDDARTRATLIAEQRQAQAHNFALLKSTPGRESQHSAESPQAPPAAAP